MLVVKVVKVDRLLFVALFKFISSLQIFSSSK